MFKWLALVCLALFEASEGATKICNILCDGDSVNKVTNARIVHTTVVFERIITILVSDTENVAFARIENGDHKDEVWLDRSFTGGRSWNGGSKLGDTKIPADSRTTNTDVFNIDGALDNQQIGVLRACGKANNRPDTHCTEWTRTTVHAASPAEAAATTLMMYYKANGLWDTTGWWNSANCLIALIDFMKVTGDRSYLFAVDNTYQKNKGNHFINEYEDESAWWGLALVSAFDLTENFQYLATAQMIVDHIKGFTDDVCGGGIYWTTQKTYKNAATNELFMKLAAALHNRTPGDTKYLVWAMEIWEWFDKSGMINENNIVNDGLDTLGSCKNNGWTTWTHNQGTILGAMVELYRATGNQTYLDRARLIADATVNSPELSPNGILHEPCDHDQGDCGKSSTFKGVFARNLGELNQVLPGNPYSSYINHNADTIYENRNSIDQFGLHYEGPLEFFNAETQQSAFDMLIAQERLRRA